MVWIIFQDKVFCLRWSYLWHVLVKHVKGKTFDTVFRISLPGSGEGIFFIITKNSPPSGPSPGCFPGRPPCGRSPRPRPRLLAARALSALAGPSGQSGACWPAVTAGSLHHIWSLPACPSANQRRRRRRNTLSVLIISLASKTYSLACTKQGPLCARWHHSTSGTELSMTKNEWGCELCLNSFWLMKTDASWEL